MKWPTVVPTQRNKLVAASAVLITMVAVVDAVAAGTWDLVVVLGLAVAAQSLLLLSMHAPRPAVPLRGDLFRWLDERSAATGEPLEHIADRCVAAYRSGLTREPPVGSGGN